MLYLWINNLKKVYKCINYQKVRDHCYSTGKYRGAAHSIWNSKFGVPNETPVVFNNGSNYDLHSVVNKFYYSRRDWGEIWMSYGKYRKMQIIFLF